MNTTTVKRCHNCPHSDWQHAREGDPRLESEEWEIGACYVEGCKCPGYVELVEEPMSDDEIREAEDRLKEIKRQREIEKWDRELVGRAFRIGYISGGWTARVQQMDDNYVALEHTLAVGRGTDFVFADAYYVYVQRRDEGTLICSGFAVSGSDRKERYLKVQPYFESYDDFRKYLGSWRHGERGPKMAEEISVDLYWRTFVQVSVDFQRMMKPSS